MGLFSRKEPEPVRDPDYPAQIERLKKERRSLKDQIADLKHEKKITEEDIKHMVRIREERIEVENEKKNLERDREKEQEIAKVKDEYRDKLEERLHKEVENMKEMYTQILQRLPTVEVAQSHNIEETRGASS